MLTHLNQTPQTEVQTPMTETLASVSEFPQTAALQKRVADLRQKGLVDVKFFATRKDDSTVESFCSEVNEMLAAPVVHDVDLI